MTEKDLAGVRYSQSEGQNRRSSVPSSPEATYGTSSRLGREAANSQAAPLRIDREVSTRSTIESDKRALRPTTTTTYAHKVKEMVETLRSAAAGLTSQSPVSRIQGPTVTATRQNSSGSKQVIREGQKRKEPEDLEPRQLSKRSGFGDGDHGMGRDLKDKQRSEYGDGDRDTGKVMKDKQRSESGDGDRDTGKVMKDQQRSESGDMDCDTGKVIKDKQRSESGDGDYDTVKGLKDKHIGRGEQQAGGVLLENLEIDESPQERDPVHSSASRGMSIWERERVQRAKNKALSTELHRTQAQSDEYRAQIEKMAQIIQQLQRQGLPLPPDDGHFSRELGQLWSDIAQWARLASKGQPQITSEIWRSLSSENREFIKAAFADFTESVKTKRQRTLRASKIMELIIFRGLQAFIFGNKVVGLSTTDSGMLVNLCKSMLVGNSTTDRDIHCWNALSIHLLTKGNEKFEKDRESEVDKLTNALTQELSLLGAPGRTSFDDLRQLAFRAVDIGLQIAQLPFAIMPWETQPGMPFQNKWFEDVDMDDEYLPEELEIMTTPIALVLTPTVVKLEFDSEGKKMNYEAKDADKTVIIAKGRVICHL